MKAADRLSAWLTSIILMRSFHLASESIPNVASSFVNGPIVLIDNYVDERTMMLLGSRRAKVSCTVYTLRPNSPKLAPALTNYAKG